MLKSEIKDHIYGIVVSCQGCKATEIITKLNAAVLQAMGDGIDLPTIIAELIHERRLIEVEYELPEMNWRSKSFLLPFKTEVRINRCESEIESEFYEHLDAWKEETRHQSSSTVMVNNPHYQAIIEMGRDVVPVILEYIKDSPDHFSYALMMITGEDPTFKSAQGDIKANCYSWVKWGREKSLIK